MKLNKDHKTRDLIIHGKETSGNCEHYDGLTVDKLDQLLEQGFADPEETQNDSPTIQMFLDFMEDFPDVTAHGYTIGIERDDYRVSVEGISYVGDVDTDLMCAFVELCRHADEFTCSKERLYAWWD